MDENLKKSLKETYEIIQNSENKIIEKIPNNFLKFIEDNMDKNYNLKINFDDENWKNKINNDTKAILALIYRDYIVDAEKRNKLIQEEKAQREIYEKELREKYNPDEIFKNRTVKEDEVINNNQLIEVKEAPWYKKIIESILRIFGRRN